MEPQSETCWTLIRGAAAGDAGDRERFCRRYDEVLRAFYGARWGKGPRAQLIEDAVQEVFLECFRDAGALERVEPDRPGGFRAFFYAVARNVALRVEKREAKRRARGEASEIDLDTIPSGEESLSAAFDRAWAGSILREAAALQRERARAKGPEASGRVEILDLRFGEGLPIRDIAARRGDDPAAVHHEYAKARREFRAALHAVLAFHHPRLHAEEIDREGQRLLDLFQ